MRAFQANESINITTSGVSVSAPIPGYATPGLAPGSGTRFVRVAATAATFVALGDVGVVVAAATGLLVQPGDQVILKLAGRSHIAVLQTSAPGNLCVTALADSQA